uniref:Glutamyl-tRNA(Gln) amidotransferase subunit A, mitochondrial n=1 Tax=Onchocerca volvulus TaxID=6282 RepID=A0A8R1XUM5_ONCVO
MECVEKAISRAVKYRKFNSLITETFDLACVQAKEALKKGKTPFPVVVKDCYMIKKVRTTCASRNLSNFIAPYTATIVNRLFEQGGCLIGKANMDEFCMGTSSSKSHFGPVKNGLSDEANLETDWRSPGGSSGGCGVAVQLGISSVSLGSDTGGSSRNPAAFTGLFGFKPSYGVLSRYGLIPLVNSLDCPSIIAKTVKNCNFLLQVMSGRDIFDSTCIDAPSSCFMQGRPISGIIVGIPKEYHNETLSSECWKGWNEAAKALAVLGCKIKEVSMPFTTYSIICYHVLAEADITSNMARYDGVKYGHRSDCDRSTSILYSATRSESLNDVVRRRIFAGNYFLMKCHYDEYFGQALRVRRLIKMDFDRVFREEDCDVLLTPVTSSIPPLFSEISDADGYKRECEDDFYTQPCNMAGVPAISVPFTKTADGFPIGVQIIADHLKDGLTLDVAEKLYQYSDA